jgi:hypothetical protein
MRYPFKFTITTSGGTGIAAGTVPPSSGPGTGSATENARTFTVSDPLVSSPSDILAIYYKPPSGTIPVPVTLYVWITDNTDTGIAWVALTTVSLVSGMNYIHLPGMPKSQSRLALSVYVKVSSVATAPVRSGVSHSAQGCADRAPMPGY